MRSLLSVLLSGRLLESRPGTPVWDGARRLLRRRSRVAGALVVVAALVAPGLGTALDHHFAERNQAHGHMSPHSAVVGHVHEPNRPHQHSGSPRPALQVDAAVITPDMGAEPAGPLLLNTCDCGLAALLSVPMSALLLAGAGPERHAAGAGVAPPDQPPRA